MPGSVVAPAGEYEPEPEQQAVIQRIKTERSAGATLRATASKLNGEGTAPPSGRCWHPATIKLIAERATA
jgi:hypothetical protein